MASKLKQDCDYPLSRLMSERDDTSCPAPWLVEFAKRDPVPCMLQAGRTAKNFVP